MTIEVRPATVFEDVKTMVGPKRRYAIDNKGKKIDQTMAYAGTRGLFEKAGFKKAADADSVLNGWSPPEISA
jgi:hypothetical protein